MKTLAPYFALFFLLPVPFSLWNAWRKRQLLEKQNDLHSIRELSWKAFEELVAEAYRRQGYRVVENTSGGADGGIDISITKEYRRHLVQCKQWRTEKVGVRIVREMYGIMTAENAASVIVITSGGFTADAQQFAVDKPIELIDGQQLARLIGHLRTTIESEEQTPEQRLCPQCGNHLVLRTAKRGEHVGNQFYGCSSYPQCRYIQPQLT